jgi:uncharacterized protein (TIGR02001 family)
MKTLRCLAWVLVAVAMLSVSALAQEAALIQDSDSEWRPGVDFVLDYGSRYIYKGEVWNPDRVLQADLCLSLKGFYAGVWTCYDFTDANGYNNEPEEWNYYLGYEYQFTDIPLVESITLGLGWIYFDYPRASAWDTQELNFGVMLEDVLLTPKMVVNWDYENDTWWVEAGIRHEMPLESISDKLLFGVGLDLIWGNTRWCGYVDENQGPGVDKTSDAYKNALISAVLITDLKYQFNENIAFGPYMIGAWAIDHDMREKYRADDVNNDFNFVWGVKLDMAF